MKNKILFLFVFMLWVLPFGCYHDEDLVREEEMLENEFFFHPESKAITLEMLETLFDEINSSKEISKADIVQLCERISDVINYQFLRLRDAFHAMLDLNIKMKITIDLENKTFKEDEEIIALWNYGEIIIRKKEDLKVVDIIIHEMI